MEVRKKREANERKDGRGSAGGRGGRAGAGRALTPAELAIRQRVLEEQRKEAAREAARIEEEKIRILSAAEEAKREEEARAEALAREAEAAREAEEHERQMAAAAEDKAKQEALEEQRKARAAEREREEAARRAPLEAAETVRRTGGVQLAAPMERLRPLAERAVMAPRPVTPKPAPAANNAAAAPRNETLHLRRGGAAGGEAEDDRRASRVVRLQRRHAVVRQPHPRKVATRAVRAVLMFGLRLKVMMTRRVRSPLFVVSAIVSVVRPSWNVCVPIRYALYVT